MRLRTRLALAMGGISLLSAGGLFGATLVLLERSADRQERLAIEQTRDTLAFNRDTSGRFLAGMCDGIDELLARVETAAGTLTVRAAAAGNPDAQRELLRLLGEEAARRQLDVLDLIGADGRVLASAHWPPSSLSRTDGAARKREGNTGYVLMQTAAESGAAFDENGDPVSRIAFVHTVRLSAAPELLLVAGFFADDEERLKSLAGADRVSIQATGREPTVVVRARDPFDPPAEVEPPPDEIVFDHAESQPLLASFDAPDDESRTVTVTVRRPDEGAMTRRRLLVAFVAVAAVLLAACFPAASVLSRRFAAPIDALADGARAIASGALEHRIAVPPGGRKDEVRELVEAFNGMARDLKESRAKLVQTERVAAWREIARRIAHEIKNPLTPIQLAVETTRRAHRDRRPEFDEILEESARAILEEVESLKKLVKEFSEFARMPDPVLAPDDVNDVVKGALRVFTGLPGGVALDADLADALPRVKLDRDQMTRVLINLIANAVDAVGAKGRVLVRTARVRDERGDGVELQIVDDGPGIPAADRERIFTPYFTTKENGTGLGLAIVQRIVIDHGGEIALADGPGRGTTFVVRLRAIAGPAPAVAPAA